MGDGDGGVVVGAEGGGREVGYGGQVGDRRGGAGHQAGGLSLVLLSLTASQHFKSVNVRVK